jgi:polysaccharide biosynthesis/export protein
MNTKMNKTIRLSAILATMFAFVGVGFAQNQTVASANNTPDTPAASTAKADQASSSATTRNGFQERHPRYKIAAGDAFDVSFELNPEFNQTVTVQPDGFVTLRGIGDVQVQDQTVPELTETIRGAYAKILNDPMVSIILKDFQKPYFIADGQIGKPGKYELRGETTLTEAIAIAGGFTDSSKHSQVVLFRKASNGWYTGDVFDVKKMEHTRDLHEDPQLQPGDMLFVPKSRYGKIRLFLPGSSMGAFVPLTTP